MSYVNLVEQLSFVHQHGMSGVIFKDNTPIQKPLWSQSVDVTKLVQKIINDINTQHSTISTSSELKTRILYFTSKKLFSEWNEQHSNMQVNYSQCLKTDSMYFPSAIFKCTFETAELKPLVVEPESSMTFNDFNSWVVVNKKTLQQALQEHGAIVFRGFEITEKNFPTVFKSFTGNEPKPYQGDTPRDQVGPNVYRSTAIADGHKLPLHQEVSNGSRANMPKNIAFYCCTPPLPGRGGQTTLGDAKSITDQLKEKDLWKHFTQKSFTYVSRYLPDNTLHTRWIKTLNPSHATVKEQFKTDNNHEIAQKCQQDGTSCKWKNGVAIITRPNIPATIDVNGEELFCNQAHVNKLTPSLCGSAFNYWMARALLYQTEDSTQFDIRYDTGHPFSKDVAERVLAILQQHEIVRDWKCAGEVLFIHNHTTMHGKRPHEGSRSIITAMD